MGIGDDIMATGLARGAAARGKRIAFGDGHRQIWGPTSAMIFRDNPNIAKLGTERASDIEWCRYHKGHRIYNSLDQAAGRWIWNKRWKAIPGEFYFSEEELRFGEAFERGLVVVEPTPPMWKSVAPNKDWGQERFIEVARILDRAGFHVVQFRHNKTVPHRLLPEVEVIDTPTFRFAAVIISRAALYVGVEGGLHHAAAAVGTDGVVIFGGFIPPYATGYDIHANIAVGEACGRIHPCPHCRKALDSISVETVARACLSRLSGNARSRNRQSSLPA